MNKRVKDFDSRRLAHTVVGDKKFKLCRARMEIQAPSDGITVLSLESSDLGQDFYVAVLR